MTLIKKIHDSFMDPEMRLKIGIIGAFLLLGVLFSFFLSPIYTQDTEVKGEIVGSFQVPIEGRSKKYIKVRLEDGNEVNSRVDKVYRNIEGKRVILLKRVAGTTEYALQEIIE